MEEFRDFPDLGFADRQKDFHESGRTEILEILSSLNQGSDNDGGLRYRYPPPRISAITASRSLPSRIPKPELGNEKTRNEPIRRIVGMLSASLFDECLNPDSGIFLMPVLPMDKKIPVNRVRQKSWKSFHLVNSNSDQ